MNFEISIVTTVITGIITIITIIIGNLSIKRNQEKAILVDIITKQRIHWLETIRNEIASFLRYCNLYLVLRDNFTKNSNDRERSFDFLSNYLYLLHTIELRLNPIEDNELIELLNKTSQEIKTNITYDLQTFSNDSKQIVSLSQKILKREWEKVKSEAIKFKIDYQK